MGLSTEKCVPCEGVTNPLNEQEARQCLAQVPGWNLRQDARAISRRFEFKNFVQALSFVNKVGEVCESQKHHADISFGWGYAEVLVQTHTINGLHPNDFILAAKINEISQ